MKIYVMHFGTEKVLEATKEVYRKDLPGVLKELETAWGEDAVLKTPSKYTKSRIYYKTMKPTVDLLKKALTEDTLHLVHVVDGQPMGWVNINPIMVV